MNNQILSVLHYNSLTNGELKQYLYDHGPIPVGIHASDASFSMYQSGVYDGCTSSAPDHAVLLVGFTAEGHWIIKNSWG